MAVDNSAGSASLANRAGWSSSAASTSRASARIAAIRSRIHAWLRLASSVVGVLLIVLGLVQSGVVLGRINVADRLLRDPLARRQARLRRERPVLGYGLFGFGYVLAGFG